MLIVLKMREWSLRKQFLNLRKFASLVDVLHIVILKIFVIHVWDVEKDLEKS